MRVDNSEDKYAGIYLEGRVAPTDFNQSDFRGGHPIERTVVYAFSAG